MILHVILDRQQDKNIMSVTKLLEGCDPFTMIVHEERAHNPVHKFVDSYKFKIEGIGLSLAFSSAEIDLRPVPNPFKIEVFRSNLLEPFIVSVKPDAHMSGTAEAGNAIDAWLGIFSIVVGKMNAKDLHTIFRPSWDGSTMQEQYEYIIKSLLPICSEYTHNTWDSQTEEDSL